MTKELVVALLSDDNGISGEAYGFLRDCCVDQWGSSVGRLLIQFVDAVDDRFYVSSEDMDDFKNELDSLA